MSNPTIYGNLSNQFPDNTLATGTTDLKSSVSTLNTNLDAINNKSDTLLTGQMSLSGIINDEQDRLNQKKQSVDNAYSSQVRSIYMNDNIVKRNNAYLKILYVLVIVLVIAFIISMLGNYFTIISPFILNFIYIGLFSFAVIYSISIYSEIQKHERIDYDKLKLGKATKPGYDYSTKDSSGNDNSGNSVYGNCAQLNPVTGNCTKLITNDKESFSGNELSSSNNSEFTHYSRY